VADIKTTRTMQAGNGVEISMVSTNGGRPDRIVIAVDNEGVRHHLAVNVDEATQMAVQILRMTTVLLGVPSPETPKPRIHLVGGS